MAGPGFLGSFLEFGRNWHLYAETLIIQNCLLAVDGSPEPHTQGPFYFCLFEINAHYLIILHSSVNQMQYSLLEAPREIGRRPGSTYDLGKTQVYEMQSKYTSRPLESTQRSVGAQSFTRSIAQTNQDPIKIEENFIKTPRMSILKQENLIQRDPHFGAQLEPQSWTTPSHIGSTYIDYKHPSDHGSQPRSRVIGPPSAYYDPLVSAVPILPTSEPFAADKAPRSDFALSSAANFKQHTGLDTSPGFIRQGAEVPLIPSEQKQYDLPRGFRLADTHRLERTEPNPEALHKVGHSTQGHLGYAGSSFVNYRHELAGLPSENLRLDDYTPYYRMRQDVGRLN